MEDKTLDDLLQDPGNRNESRGGLKTAKSKCLSKLKDKVMEACKNYHIKPRIIRLRDVFEDRERKIRRLQIWRRYEYIPDSCFEYRLPTMATCCCHMLEVVNYNHAPEPTGKRAVILYKVKILLRIQTLYRRGLGMKVREVLKGLKMKYYRYEDHVSPEIH